MTTTTIIIILTSLKIITAITQVITQEMTSIMMKKIGSNHEEEKIKTRRTFCLIQVYERKSKLIQLSLLVTFAPIKTNKLLH